MLSFMLTVIRLLKSILRSWSDPLFRASLALVSLSVLSGTLFYHKVEGWSWLDSAYFTIATISTVGYGDLAPATNAGKLFTIIFIVVGVGLFVALVSRLAAALIKDE